jgi:hypothetical protein
MTTMLFERVGDVIVLVHGAHNPSDSDWNAYIEYGRAALFGSKPPIGLLVTTFGGSPNASQRRAVLAAVGSKIVPACVCTDSVVARGVITAFSWITTSGMHALPLNDLDAALRLLKVPDQQHPAIKATIQRLQSQLNNAHAS